MVAQVCFHMESLTGKDGSQVGDYEACQASSPCPPGKCSGFCRLTRLDGRVSSLGSLLTRFAPSDISGDFAESSHREKESKEGVIQTLTLFWDRDYGFLSSFLEGNGQFWGRAGEACLGWLSLGAGVSAISPCSSEVALSPQSHSQTLIQLCVLLSADKIVCIYLSASLLSLPPSLEHVLRESTDFLRIPRRVPS